MFTIDRLARVVLRLTLPPPISVRQGELKRYVTPFRNYKRTVIGFSNFKKCDEKD